MDKGHQNWSFLTTVMGVVMSVALLSSTAIAKLITADQFHSCMIRSDNKVLCWGLGTSTTNTPFIPTVMPLGKNDVPISVSATNTGTYILLKNGTIKNLANISTTIDGITNATVIASGKNHTCALLSTGNVKCWGKNDSGQLGNNSKNNNSTPVFVRINNKNTIPLGDVTAIALGDYHSCALIKDGDIKCWGKNHLSQLATSPNKYYIPVPVVIINGTGKKAISIFAGGDHSCALLENKTVICWGTYKSGEHGNSVNTKQPVTVVGELMGTKDLALGNGYTCALLLNGSVKCLGSNTYGKLGNGKFDTSQDSFNPSPVSVGGISNAIAITSGGYHTCALLPGNVVKCWGLDQSGEIGISPKSTLLESNGSFAFSPTPITVTDPLKRNIDYTNSWFDFRKQKSASMYRQIPSKKDLTQPSFRFRKSVGGIESDKSLPKDTLSATKTYWDLNKPKVKKLMADLATASNAVNIAQENLQNEANATIDSISNNIFESKNKQPLPAVTIATGVALYTTAQDTLESTFKQLNDILIVAIKQDEDGNSYEISETLGEISLAYMNAMFTASVKLPLSDITKSNCQWDIMEDQLIYKLVTGQQTLPGGKNNLETFIHTLNNCLSQKKLNMLDETLSIAWMYANAIIKKFHPAYVNYVQDYHYGRLLTIFFNIYEHTRFQGSHVPSLMFMQQYAERLKTLKPNTKSPPETGVNIIPDILMLYNPTSKKAEEVKLCSILSSPDMVWNATWECMFYPNFIKNLMDPTMNGDGTCLFWDTARLGKPCVMPKKETGWLDMLQKAVNSTSFSLENLFISTAYALEKCPPVQCYPGGNAGFCQKQNLWSNYYSKCQPSNGGKVIYESCDDSDNTCAAFLKACSETCAPSPPGPPQPDCQACAPPENDDGKDACDNKCKKKKNCYEKCLDDIKTGELKTDSSCYNFFNFLDKSKDPKCTVEYSPWEGENCPITPYKIGDPCWKALQSVLHICQKDAGVVQCIQDCKNSEDTVPSEILEECIKNPPLIKTGWEDDFGKENQKMIKDILNSISPLLGVPNEEKLKKEWLTKADDLYIDRIDDLITVFENIVSYKLTPDEKIEAKLYGRGTLAAAHPCGDDYELGKLGDDYAAFIDQAFICWNPVTFNETVPATEAAQVLAHEGGHAMLFYAWAFARRAGYNDYQEWTSSEQVKKCGMEDYGTWDPEHWMMDYMYPLGLVNNKNNIWDYEPEAGKLSDKSLLCKGLLLIK